MWRWPAVLLFIGVGCGDNVVSQDACVSCVSPSRRAREGRVESVTICGNGVVDLDEACDDGNTTSGDGCNATCTSDETCGNGFRDPDEWCDDGNTMAGDGCDPSCLEIEPCGNAVVEPLYGEQCDDGNTISGDGCYECHWE